VVILCEPQFKPSIENQAISRAYRMGQTRKVYVHRLLYTDTIDERIMQILANKQRIFDTFADRSVAAEQVDQAFNRETMDQIVRDELRKSAGAR
jgi:SNF2 family DNA or RNA helicase